jgi:hypothetical protein
MPPFTRILQWFSEFRQILAPDRAGTNTYIGSLPAIFRKRRSRADPT